MFQQSLQKLKKNLSLLSAFLCRINKREKIRLVIILSRYNSDADKVDDKVAVHFRGYDHRYRYRNEV
jgi:hypothetical protein